MGIDNLDALKEHETIHDMGNFIRSRQRKGHTASQIRKELMGRGYDAHAAHGLVMLHWVEAEDE